MDNKRPQDALAPPGPNKPDSEVLNTEEKLWQRVEADLLDESAHLEYVGFALKHNILKAASRRYGAVVDAKDKYSVEQRRSARQHQQKLLKILFFDPKGQRPKSRLSRLELMLLFLATMLMMGGLFSMMADTSGLPPIVALVLKLMFPLGLGYVAVFIWARIKKVQRNLEGLAD